VTRNQFILCLFLSAFASVSSFAQLTIKTSYPLPVGGSTAFDDSVADNRYCIAPNKANFGAATDGPANLPTSCIHTAMSSTPSPGATWLVCARGCAFQTVQAALNDAACGDVIELAAGETFSGAGLRFPAKGCDNAHWITVRTSTPDNLLPREGARMTPCWAGVASLPGRPDYACPSSGVPPKSLLAKIVVSPTWSMKLPGDHYRLIGLELTRPVGGGFLGFLAQTARGSYIVFDRLWIHGTTRDDTAHGVVLHDAHHVAVIDSYLSDMHCIATSGVCSDAQAIGGGNNSIAGYAGAFKIVNNFLEASGVNIMFGGGASKDTSGDIEIRRNHFYKPRSWNPADPTYGNIRFSVKNHLELKNASRVLVEGNVMENVWGGFSQTGAHILLTPKNQAKGLQNLCPNCFVTHVTIRYNHLKTGAQAFQIANGANGNGAYATAGRNYSIHDNLTENLTYRTCYGCANQYILMATGSLAPLSDILANITLSHNTFVVATSAEGTPTNAGFLSLGGPKGKPQPNIKINDNIFAGGYYGPWSVGGLNNCARDKPSPEAKFDACWSNWSFAGNAVTSGLDIHQFPNWPDATKIFPTDQLAVGYVNLNAGFGGNYRLGSGSPLRGKALDGSDPGADIDALNAHTAGVD